MAVAVDATGTALIGPSSVTTINYTGITVGAALSNGALVVTFTGGVTNAITGLSATWDVGGTNQAMTLIGSQSLPLASNGTIAIFGLRNPTSGNKTLTVSWTGASFPVIEAISFTGVDQTSNAAAFKNFLGANGTSTALAVTITSAVGELPVAILGTDGTISAPNQTQVYLDITSSGLDGCAQRAVGAASVAFQNTATGGAHWGAAGFSLGAAAAGATLPFSLTDWPRVSPIRVSKPDGSRALNPNQFTNPIPINNSSSLFIPVQPVKLAKVDQFHTDISKFTNPIPLNVQELNRPWSVKGYPTQPQPYNPNLYSQVIVAAPFAQLQWVAARPLYSQVATPVNPPYNSLIYSEVPFVNNVPTKVSPVVSAPFISQVYNVNLYSQVVSPAPFVTVDYSRVYPIRGVSQQVQGYNVNLYQTVSASVTARLGFHPIEAGSVKQTNIASGLQNLEDGTAG